MGLKFLLVGPDQHNSTDGFIIRGIRRLLSEAFPGFEETYHFLYDHGPRTYEPSGEYDAIVVCGTPWIWDHFYNSHKYKNLLSIFGAHPKAKKMFVGIGTCFNLDAMDTDICEDPKSQDAMRYLYNDTLVFTRECLARDKLNTAGVDNIHLPCPAFYSVTTTPLEENSHNSFCWVDPRQTISSQYWIQNKEDFENLLDKIYLEIKETNPKIFKTLNKDANYSEIDTSTVCSSTVPETISILSHTRKLISMRVHWAVPAMAMGRDVSIIPLDSRYLTTHVDLSKLDEYRKVYINKLREFLGYVLPNTA